MHPKLRIKPKLHRKPKWYRTLAHKFGYDIVKLGKQLLLESYTFPLEFHLRNLFPMLSVDLVLDVGAHKGEFARMLRHTGYHGEIISFEPAESSFVELSRETKDDVKWSAHRLALSDHAGEAELHLLGKPDSDLNSLHSFSSFGEHKYRHRSGYRRRVVSTETVSLGRLDEFLARHVPDFARRRVFLKMDTQGHNLRVFAGAGDYAGRFCGLVSEVSVMPIYNDIPTYMESLEIYRQHGYEVTGLYTISRNRKTGHIVEFDCVMVPKVDG